ncbi:MAG: mercury methylation corrinoid protein HgcA, partial [Bacillota bacterium]
MSTHKHVKDYLGTLKVRLGINRMNYKIPSGLYAIGQPDKNSQVIVSCNYKLTFDALRTKLKETNIWVLILDTKGINVWCAGGKGTFGSKELIYQVEKWNLSKLVNHKKLILPQLGASSMEPHLVQEFTGFNISYGPIRAKDLKEYLNTGKASEEMRQVKFNFFDRLVLTPIEFIHNLSFALVFMIIALVIRQIFKVDLLPLMPSIIMALFIGSIIFPLTLPILPFRSFSMKSIILIIPFLIFLKSKEIQLISDNVFFETSYFLLLGLLIMYQSFNFTGSTTFTSFSGVKKETKY